MAGNNTNIVHVNAVKGLLDAAMRRLKQIEPDKSDADKCSEQTIAKESALTWLEIIINGDINKLQQVFE